MTYVKLTGFKLFDHLTVYKKNVTDVYLNC